MTMKNWLPAAPAGSSPRLAIATTPCVYFVPGFGLSTTVYPGSPVPLPVGSPPWIRKPGTIRWKIVPSKKPLRTRAANEAVTLGEVFWSSMIVKSPSLVFISTE